MPEVAASEWLKLRSVPSTFYLLFTVAAVTGLSALLAWQLVNSWDPSQAANAQAMRPEKALLLFVQLALGVLGVLAFTSEYATGTIMPTLIAVPQRGRVLAAKTAVVAVVGLLTGQASVFAMFFLTRLVVGDRPIPLYAPALVDEIPLLLSLGVSVMVVTLLGLGLGAVTRSTAGALTALVALLFVVPPLGRLLPHPWDDRFTAVMLPLLPEQLAGVPDAYLTPLGAAAALAVYVAAALTAAAVVLHHRDA